MPQQLLATETEEILLLDFDDESADESHHVMHPGFKALKSFLVPKTHYVQHAKLVVAKLVEDCQIGETE